MTRINSALGRELSRRLAMDDENEAPRFHYQEMDEIKTAAKDVAELWSRIDKRTLAELDANEQALCIGFMTTGYVAGFRRANGIDDIFSPGPLTHPTE